MSIAVTFAAGLSVRAQAEDVDLALHPRVEVLVGTTPGVVGELVQVGLPVRGGRPGGGLAYQGLQALLARGEALVVELVELERLHQVVDVGARGGGARVVGAIEHIGHDQRTQHPDDDQHHHEFDQGEAALAQARNSG